MWMTAGGKGLPVEVQKQPICTNLHVLTEISTRSTLSYKTLIYTLLERSWTEVARLGSCSARCRLLYKFIEFAIKTEFHLNYNCTKSGNCANNNWHRKWKDSCPIYALLLCYSAFLSFIQICRHFVAQILRLWAGVVAQTPELPPPIIFCLSFDGIF